MVPRHFLVYTHIGHSTIAIAELLVCQKKYNIKLQERSFAAKDTSEHRRHKKVKAAPCYDVQNEGYEHWPIFDKKRNRCKLCTEYQSKVICKKCEANPQQTSNSFMHELFAVSLCMIPTNQMCVWWSVCLLFVVISLQISGFQHDIIFLSGT